MLNEQGILWKYLSEGQRALIQQGYYLLEDAKSHSPAHKVLDYSYLVFCFAKAYEGFLKQLFLDSGFITRSQYESDHFRIGRSLSPNLAKLLRRGSIYTQLLHKFGNNEVAEMLWQMWKKGRNVVFHYFPHNIQALTLSEAESLIVEFVEVMEKGVVAFKFTT